MLGRPQRHISTRRRSHPHETGLPIDNYRRCCLTTKAKLQKAHAYLQSAEILWYNGVPLMYYQTVHGSREEAVRRFNYISDILTPRADEVAWYKSMAKHYFITIWNATYVIRQGTIQLGTPNPWTPQMVLPPPPDPWTPWAWNTPVWSPEADDLPPLVEQPPQLVQRPRPFPWWYNINPPPPMA